MSRKVLFAVLALALVGAACANKAAGNQPVQTVFLPQTVDALISGATADDLGRGNSLILDKSGNPYLSYLGLLPVLPSGDFPPARPVNEAALPAVLVAHRSSSGMWNHGFVVQTDISKPVDQQKPLPITDADRTSLALDSKGGQHVVWTQSDGLFYADDSASPGTFGAPQTITTDYAFGPSIAVDSNDKPWVSFLTATGLQVATQSGKTWKIQQVAAISLCPTCPTPNSVIKIGPQGTVIAYSDTDTNTLMLARLSGTTWTTEPIQKGVGGSSISMALDSSGNVHVAFVTSNGEVWHAESDNSGPWMLSKVGSFAVKNPLTDLSLGTAIAVDSKGTHYVAWGDPRASQLRLATSPNGSSFKLIPTPETEGGEYPNAAVDSKGKLYVSWFSSADTSLFLGTYPEQLSQEALAVPTPSAGVASAPSGPPAGTCQPNGTSLSITAQNIAFNTSCLAAPAGRSFTLSFDNKDAIEHNVDIYTSSNAKTHLAGAALGTGITGPATTTYHITGLKPGTYYFQCDFHPTQMNGTFVVK